MQITYELTQKDFFHCFVAHRNRSFFAKWSFRIVISIVFALAGAGLFLLVLQPSFQVLSNLAPLLGLAALWAVLMWASPWWMARTQFLKQPAAHGPRTLLLDSAGVHWRWDGGSADIEWKNLIRFLESKNHFLLYSSPVCFDIVPKSALAPEQLADFRSLLAQHISGGGRK